MTRLTSVQTRDLQLFTAPRTGIPEVNLDLILQSRRFLLRLYSPAASAAAPKNWLNKSRKAARPAPPLRSRQNQTAKVEIHAASHRLPLWRRSPGLNWSL